MFSFFYGINDIGMIVQNNIDPSQAPAVLANDLAVYRSTLEFVSVIIFAARDRLTHVLRFTPWAGATF